MLTTLFFACTSGGSSTVRAPAQHNETATDSASDSSPSDDTPSDDTASDTTPDNADDTAPEAPCATGMALVGDFCIDRFEATLQGQSPYEVPASGIAVSTAGVPPQAYISGDVAATACAASGKRLCTSDEWLAACSGGSRQFPYGNTYDASACNTEYPGDHPVCDYFGTCDGVWDSEHMNDPGINQQPGSLANTGAFEACVTPEGVYDLHGNVHEWVSDVDGTFRGGFYADASINGTGCEYRTTAHSSSYHDYSTGFRCCAEPR